MQHINVAKNENYYMDLNKCKDEVNKKLIWIISLSFLKSLQRKTAVLLPFNN